MHCARRLLITLTMLCAMLVSTSLLAAEVPASQTWLEWEYPFNTSTTRTYTAENARIVLVDEYVSTEEGGHFQDWEGDAQSVTMSGERALDVVLVIEPFHPSCWRIDLTSDDPRLQRTWRSARSCHQLYLPMAAR